MEAPVVTVAIFGSLFHLYVSRTHSQSLLKLHSSSTIVYTGRGTVCSSVAAPSETGKHFVSARLSPNPIANSAATLVSINTGSFDLAVQRSYSHVGPGTIVLTFGDPIQQRSLARRITSHWVPTAKPRQAFVTCVVLGARLTAVAGGRTEDDVYT
jgi:hypothetical protein